MYQEQSKAELNSKLNSVWIHPDKKKIMYNIGHMGRFQQIMKH